MPEPYRPYSGEMEALKLTHNLTPDSLVVDVGAFLGDFTAAMRDMYDARILAYEPCPIYQEHLRERFQTDPKVTIVRAGLGNQNRKITLGFEANSTGLFADGTHFPADIHDAASLPLPIDLLKLNIEGMEYDVLERLIETNATPRITTLLIQFHCLRPDHEQRHDAIRQTLTRTHTCTWRVPWTWESWDLRNIPK